MKKIILLLLSAYAICGNVYSQISCNPNEIFAICEEPPRIKNEHKRLNSELTKKLDLEKIEDGTIVLKCTISCEDKLVNLEVLQNESSMINRVIKEYIEELVKWESGKQGGIKVNSQKVLSIDYKKGKVKKIR